MFASSLCSSSSVLPPGFPSSTSEGPSCVVSAPSEPVVWLETEGCVSGVGVAKGVERGSKKTVSPCNKNERQRSAD